MDRQEEKPTRASVEFSLARMLPPIVHFPPGMEERHLDSCAQKALPDGTDEERAEFKRNWRGRRDQERERQERERDRQERERARSEPAAERESQVLTQNEFN